MNGKIVKEEGSIALIELDEPTSYTDQSDGIPTFAKYAVKGFPETILVFFADSDDEGIDQDMYFGMMIGETGLVVNLQDEDIQNQLIPFVFAYLGEEE